MSVTESKSEQKYDLKSFLKSIVRAPFWWSAVYDTKTGKFHRTDRGSTGSKEDSLASSVAALDISTKTVSEPAHSLMLGWNDKAAWEGMIKQLETMKLSYEKETHPRYKTTVKPEYKDAAKKLREKREERETVVEKFLELAEALDIMIEEYADTQEDQFQPPEEWLDKKLVETDYVLYVFFRETSPHLKEFFGGPPTDKNTQ